jgi:acetolactate synthase-1/2/3 large subunit
MGKGVVSEVLPQYVGTAALTSNDYIHEIIEKADCILAVGHDVVEKPTNIIHDPRVDLIHINFFPADVDQLYAPDLEVVGDIGNTFWQLYEAEALHADLRNFEDLYTTLTEKNKKIEQHTLDEYKEDMLGPRRLAKELRQLLAEDDILTLDNGLYKVWLARNYPAIIPNTVILDNALATMGAGYSVAMEAKLLNPDKQVVCVCGDGGLIMNLGDLETVVRL